MNYPFMTFNQAQEATTHLLKKGISVLLHGSPSSGKTALGYKIAKQYSLKPILFSAMDHDPVDLSGLPDLAGDKATFKPFDTFPISTDSIPTGYKGWLIILDELLSGSKAMQAACNKLLYERMVGDKELHPAALVVGMGNLQEDKAFVVTPPAHSLSRSTHLYVRQDIDEWVEWALNKGVDKRVISYASYKPTSVTKYDPDYVDINYPCARTLEMVSDTISGIDEVGSWLLPIIQGQLGIGAGLEFYNFCRLGSNLPTFEEILANPTDTPCPRNPAERYVLGTLIAEKVTPDTFESIHTYISKFPMDVQYFMLRMCLVTNRDLITHPLVQDWCTALTKRLHK